MKENNDGNDTNVGSMENSIEEDIKTVENYLENSAINEIDSNFFKNGGWEIVDLEIPKSIIMSKENLSTAEQLKVEIKENFRLKNQLENNRKEYQETYKDVREELKELKKENEELLQEKVDNQKIIVLAQNDMLNYQAGFEDGKNGRTSAVQSIIENQQYYIFQKQIEKYERHIEKLQKENEELTISNKEIDKECSRLEKKEVELINENEHYKDLIYALKTYYNITEEDLEECMKNDR